MKNIFKSLMIVALVAGCIFNAYAYDHIGLASGTIELGTITKAPGAGNKFGKYTDGAYLYRNSAWSFSSGKGIKTQNSNSGVVFYLANSADITINILYDASKNFANVNAQLYSISDSDYDKFYTGTENNTVVTFSTTDYTTKTVVIDKKGDFQETFSALPAGYYYIVCTGTGSNTYFTKLITSSSTPADPTVTSVTVSPSSATLEINDTKQLTAIVEASPASADKTVTWTSNNTGVATVSESGVVTAVAQGTATITATSKLDNTKSGTCTVTVTAPAAPIEVESISIKSATTISIGSSETLSVTYTPTDANTGKAITWTSNNTNIASVDNTGKVTGVAAGTATITATSEKGKTAICTVTVKAVAVTGVSINPATATVKIGSTITLTANVTPTDATNKNVTWSSSDDNIATVVNGKVTGVAVGSATITATSVDDNTKKGECVVTVQEGTPLPDVGLVAHTPEIYEETKANKGYGGTLSQFEGREYEVYYIGRDASDQPSVAITPSGDKVKGITTSSSATTCKADDNWFELKSSGGKGGDTNAGAKDEFTDASKYSIKMKSNQEMVFQVKGFDQFNFYGKDNNKDKTKGKQFEVYIDDTKVSGDPVDGYAIHRYEINTEEHVIRLIAIGDSESKLTGFSLRIADEPLVRHLGGPKEQTVYQTKEIERVAFRIRRATSYRITWVGGKAIDGVTLVAGDNDSVFVEGTANAAAGTYIYKVEALDKDGTPKSYEQGSIKIETHIFDAQKGNSFTTNIAEPIKPLNFLYYASNNNDIQLNCGIQGLSLTYDRDSIAVLTGTPALNTNEGEYTYSISAVGGNTVTGTITIVVPDPYFEPIAEAKGKDGQPLSFSLIARHASEVAVTGLPAGFTVNYDAATDIATIAGTPNVGTPYPQHFEFTATAQPRYNGKSATTVTGKLTILDPNAQCILVVCKDLKEVSEDPIAKYLASKQYDITLREQTSLAGSGYDAFNLVVISENADADHEEVLKIIRGGENSPAVNVPVFNLKGFTYATGRLGWGRPNNGSIDTTTNGSTKIYVQREDHRIFKNLNKDHGDEMTILQYEKGKQGVMPIEIRMDDFSYCLATARTRDINDYYKDGDLQAIMHEMPAELRGGKKYICLPLARTAKLTTDGERLVNAIVKYLIEDEQETLAEPELQITRFAINGIDGDIDELNKTITVYIDTLDYPGLDFKALETEIDLKDPIYTYVKPEDGSLVNYQFATSTPVKFVVSDYIRLVTYNVKIRLREPQGIEDIYEVGQWVNIYDIYGRQLTTTNENIYTMDLPRGIYLVVTENGQTIKIMR